MFLSKEELSNKMFQVGDWIYCGLYGGTFGVITKIHGEQSPESVSNGSIVCSGGRASFDIVNERGGAYTRTPECILRGVQWKLPDRPRACPEKIQEMIKAHEESVLEAERLKAEQQAAFAAEVESLKGDISWSKLIQSSDKERGQKLANKNIRKVLKTKYPDVKFSVKKRYYDSTSVSYPEGLDLDRKALESLLDDFETGYYDVHEDLHKDSQSPFNVVFGGVGHLSVHCH